jgi:FAD synthetase
MRRVLVFGSFDHLHPGHMYFLLEAKKHGDELVVVLAREETIIEHKGRKPKYSEKERREHLEFTGIPDRILLGHIKDKYSIIERVGPDIICLGYDQNSYTKHLKEELKKRKIKAKVMRLKPYKEHMFKSSKLKA